MKSIKDIYKIGKGPSSSHTMGPFKAVRHYLENHPECHNMHVTLYGSLAATGKGHLTDWACEDAFRDGKVHIEWQPKENLPMHPNGMKVSVRNADGSITIHCIEGNNPSSVARVTYSSNDKKILGFGTVHDVADWTMRLGNTGKKVKEN